MRCQAAPEAARALAKVWSRSMAWGLRLGKVPRVGHHEVRRARLGQGGPVANAGVPRSGSTRLEQPVGGLPGRVRRAHGDRRR